MKGGSTNHYNATYFAWQSSIGEFGGWANLSKFRDFIRPEYNVLDFGCGGGYLLKNCCCNGKIGIDINEHARSKAATQGILVYSKVSEVSDEWADLIISDNALEHCIDPLGELQALLKKLKVGGKFVCVVPCESVSYRYNPQDPNFHLYSWSPMSLGNLFREAGYLVKESHSYIHKWPPYYRQIAHLMGRRWFEIICAIYGHFARSWFQVRLIAERSKEF